MTAPSETGASGPFTMLGAADAAACEGDACLVPPVRGDAGDDGDLGDSTRRRGVSR